MMPTLDDKTISYSQTIAELLGGTEVFGPEPVDRGKLLSVSAAGFSKESLEFMLNFLRAHAHGYIDVIDWLRDRLLDDQETEGVLSSSASDICLRIAALLVALVGIFDDVDSAVSFLLEPHFSLHDQTPVDAIFDPDGVKAVDYLVRSAMHAMPG